MLGCSGLRRHHRSPAQAMEPAGRDPGRAFGAPRSGTSDALFPEEVQSFPDIFSACLGQGPWTMPEVERKPGCKGSRAWDPRKDFSQCMQQPIILSTSSAISPQQERKIRAQRQRVSCRPISQTCSARGSSARSMAVCFARSTAEIVGPVIVNYPHDTRVAQGVPRDNVYDFIFYVLACLLFAGFICNALIRPVNAKWHNPVEAIRFASALLLSEPARQATSPHAPHQRHHAKARAPAPFR